MIGQSLGQYKIEERLGAGGMGVIYRATDSKLGRQVAIRVLPEALAKDPQRLARFEREARMLAALNHPNIASIHGLEEAAGVRYLALELALGETLAERLKHDALKIPEALDICRQIAGALEAAHEKGIIHRDFKPANVKISREGKAKVLDFGLAKIFEPKPADSDSSTSPTVTAAAASGGKISGTAAYMSPEQARGRPLDKRTDIWSFGCVLYEALARMPAFRGESVTDTVAAVLTREPDWGALPERIPPNVRLLLRRCLQRDPQKRLRDIGDARIELEEPTPELTATTVHARWRPVSVCAACLVLGALAASVVGWILWRTAPEQRRVARFGITPPPGEIVPFDHSSQIVFSPDGTRLVYVSAREQQRQLYLRRLDQFEAKPIAGTAGARNPFFSPDGQWVAFFQNFKLKKVALSGGAPVPICDANWLSGGIWGPDDSIVFVAGVDGISQVSASGGTPHLIARVDPQKGEQMFRSSDLLPGGKAILFTYGSRDVDSWDDAHIAVQSLQTGERKILIEGGYSARYYPSGHIVYARAGVLLAAPFDLRRLTVTGPPVPVVDSVFGSSIYGAAYYTFSDNGSLAYIPGTAVGAARTLVWVDRQGKEEALPLPPRAYLHPRIAPDGRQFAVEVEGPTHNFFLYDLARGALTKMSLEGNSHWPVWTPDGRRVTFRSSRGSEHFTMWWVPADRSGPDERLTSGSNQSAASWSPDGRVVAFTQVSPETSGDIWVLDMTGDRQPRPFVQTKFNEGSPRFSPDGRWIAYSSNESGRNEVFAQPYPGPGAKILISTGGGFDPVWAQNGKELFYRNGDSMMAVDVAPRPSFTVGKPRKLWQGPYSHGLSSVCGAPGPSSSNYDVTPSGAKFLMIKENEQEARIAQIHVALNWSEELKRLTESKRN